MPDGPCGLCRHLHQVRRHVDNILSSKEGIDVGDVSGGPGGQRRRGKGGGGQACLAGGLVIFELKGSALCSSVELVSDVMLYV